MINCHFWGGLCMYTICQIHQQSLTCANPPSFGSARMSCNTYIRCFKIWRGEKKVSAVANARLPLDRFPTSLEASELKSPGREEMFLARICRDSPEPLQRSGFPVFIEDWLAPSCSSEQSSSREPMNFKLQRVAIFSATGKLL